MLAFIRNKRPYNFLTIKGLTSLFIVSVLAISIAKVSSFLWGTEDEKRRLEELTNCGLIKEGRNVLEDQINDVDASKFIIAVVGDGVLDDTMALTRPYWSNYAQGWDLYEGVEQAYVKKPFVDVKANLERIYVDDGGDHRCAELVSQELIRSPRILGVIGHATSSTTRVALDHYKKANIPVIMPIATNPTLTTDCHNCFRLPSDDTEQAKVIAHYAVSVLNGENIYLIWDNSPSARDYAGYLQNEVTNLIGDRIKFRQSIEIQPMNYQHLLQSISLNNTDVVIFCGYGSLAREFFNGLRFEYIGNDKEKLLKRPKVILSDGSKISDIRDVARFGFETYLSFPSEKYAEKAQFKGFVPKSPPKGREKMMREESYELFGYDALSLFSIAFLKARAGEISRKSIISQLQGDLSDDSLIYRYDFKNGANIDGRYFVYALGAENDAVVKTYNKSDLGKLFPKTSDRIDKLSFDSTTPNEEKQHFENLKARLNGDANSKAVIILSHQEGAQKAQIDARVKRVFDYLRTDGFNWRRIQVITLPSFKESTEVLFVPTGVDLPPLPDKSVLQAEPGARTPTPTAEPTKTGISNR